MPIIIQDKEYPNVTYEIPTEQELTERAEAQAINEAQMKANQDEIQLRQDALNALIDDHIASDPVLSEQMASIAAMKQTAVISAKPVQQDDPAQGAQN